MENEEKKKYNDYDDEYYDNDKIPLLGDSTRLPLLLAMTHFFGGPPWRGF